MRARFNLLLDRLRTGFWFLPSIMLVLAAVLAWVLLDVDQRIDPGIQTAVAWAYSGGPEGARSLLSTIAGSMITAATVTFSLASVALSIASQQYGSRVLRNFMRDRITQVLLGIFISTFIYSVLVVRDIRGTENSPGFVPAISVTVAIALSLVSLILLVFFVHHISTSIKASHILHVIGADLEAAIPRLFPGTKGDRHICDVSGLDPPSGESQSLTLRHSGYLQWIDLDALLRLSEECNVVIQTIVKPGDFAIAGAEAARIWGTAALSDKETRRAIESFILGGERTPAQDVRYQFQQLTEVVIRALSPAINDPFTATIGINQLTSGLSQMASRPRPAEQRADAQGVLRLVIAVPQIPEILENTVAHIAIYGAADRFIMERLRNLLNVVEPHMQSSTERATIAKLRQDLEQREQESHADD